MYPVDRWLQCSRTLSQDNAWSRGSSNSDRWVLISTLLLSCLLSIIVVAVSGLTMLTMILVSESVTWDNLPHWSWSFLHLIISHRNISSEVMILVRGIRNDEHSCIRPEWSEFLKMNGDNDPEVGAYEHCYESSAEPGGSTHSTSDNAMMTMIMMSESLNWTLLLQPGPVSSGRVWWPLTSVMSSLTHPLPSLTNNRNMCTD